MVQCPQTSTCCYNMELLSILIVLYEGIHQLLVDSLHYGHSMQDVISLLLTELAVEQTVNFPVISDAFTLIWCY